MAVFVATFILAYLIDAALVGLAAAALVQRREHMPSAKALLLLLIGVFALLDIYTLPAIRVLDLHVTIGNPALSKFLERTDGSLPTFFTSVGYLDLGIWVVQALAASAVLAAATRVRPRSAA